MEDPVLLDNSFENEFRDECKSRKDTDKRVREAIKTLERELRDESVSRKTAERHIVQLYDTIEGLVARMTGLEKRIDDLESGCDDPNCKYYKQRHGGGGDGETGDALKPDNITPPSTPPTPHYHRYHGSSPIPPPTPPTPLIQRLNSHSQINGSSPRYQQQRLSAGLVPLTIDSPTRSPMSPSFPTYGPPMTSITSPAGGSTVIRAYSANNLHQMLTDKLTSTTKQNGKDEKDKDDEDGDIKGGTKDGTLKRRTLFRKTIAMLSSPPSVPATEHSPKNSRRSSPSADGEDGKEVKDKEKDKDKQKDKDKDKDKIKDKDKDKDKEKDKDESRMEKSKSFQLVRSTSQVFRLKSRSMSMKSSLKIDPVTPVAVFASMGVPDETCVKVIKDITSFLKNYVHLPPSDLFQEKAWSEQAIFLKEAIISGNIPDFSFKYQHDPHSVAQFLYELLASSDKGILNKVGQGLVDSVDIDLSVYTGLKHYKLSLLHSLVFLLDVDPHFALFYSLDLLRAFFKIRPEASLAFFGSKFGPVCLKEFPEKSSTNVFSTLLANFSAILEAKEDINFVVKDGRQTVHAASVERLFEKLLDPYYRDSLFVDTFFLTYDYFISPQDMLQKFTDYYWLAASGYPQNWKTQLSIRVLVVIKMWIMTHESFFRKADAFLCILRNFIENVTSPFPNEVAFFRYFSSLAYHNAGDSEVGSDETPTGVDGATEISDESDLSSKSSDHPNPDVRASSAMTMYDDEEDFGNSEIARPDSALQRTNSDIANVITSSTAPAILSTAPGIANVRGGTLSRSCSTSNIYLTKDGKLGTVLSGSGKFKSHNKGTNSSNIFTAFTRSTSPTSTSPRSTSPTSNSTSARSISPIPEGDTTILTSKSGSNLTINISSYDNGTDKSDRSRNLLHRKTRNRGNSDDSVLRIMAAGIAPMISSYSPVCTIDPAIVAMHMAVVDQSFLRLIPYTEWLHKAFVSTELSPNFHKMVAKFNDWGRWVCTEILRKEKLNDRVNVITYFVDIIKHSVSINNFNTAAALIGGLSHSSISRLRSTWEKVPAKVSQDFTKMTSLFDMVRNYKNYRETVKASKPPVIPYLALFPKDLIAIEEGNATILDNGLINFHKLRLLAKLIKYVSQIQQPLYVHPAGTQDATLNEYLRSKLGGKDGLLTEREMMSLSMVIQPFAPSSSSSSSSSKNMNG